MKDWLKRLVADPFAVPLILLATTFFSYGLFFWKLGFYWDDQPISWIRYELGPAATTKYFSDSRPIWAWLYQLTGYLLPQNPSVWQLFGMFWRWLGAVLLWKIASEFTPRRPDLSFFLALLFLTYPGFNQQNVSYVYSHFFIVLFFLLFSWYLMLRGKTILSIVFSALNLLMFEYFFLLEFARIMLIFLRFSDEPLFSRARFTKTLKAWFPYLSAFLPAVLYRTLVYTHPGFGYSLKDELLRAPFETLAHLISQIATHFWISAFGAWTQAFQTPNSAVNGLRSLILYFVVILSVGALTFIYNQKQMRNLDRSRSKALGLIGVGLILFALGGAAYWMTNIPVTLGSPANRALLSFVFGACVFLLGIIDLLPQKIKSVVAVTLISFSAGRQFLWSADYMRTWQAQKEMFWQMLWRAPELKADTTILINEYLDFNADNSLSAPLNWIYSPKGAENPFSYVLFYPTNRNELSLTPDSPVYFDYLAGQFHGNTSQAVVFYYAPPKCLRLLDPEIDSINKLIPDETLLRDAAALSSTAPILNEHSAQMPKIYNPEPVHGWCYYFQKADLARQLKDWKTAANLGDEALALDDYPNDPVERFVFIEGYAHVNNWQKAVELSQTSYKVSKSFVGPLLCKLWERIERETESSLEQQTAISAARGEFKCE